MSTRLPAREIRPPTIPRTTASWRDFKATAVHIAVADEAPSKWGLAKESIKDSIKNLPENIKTGVKAAANALGDAAGDVAQGVGKIANEARKGLFSGFGDAAARRCGTRRGDLDLARSVVGVVVVSKLPWIVGGVALAAYWRMRSDRRSPRQGLALPFLGTLPGRWVWPVASWNGRAPVVSDGVSSPRPGQRLHGGVDIMFRRQPGDTFKPGSPQGTKLFVMPDDHPVLAASDGVVWSAMQTPQGNAVVIDHGKGRGATFYTHLDKMLVTPTAKAASKQLVRAGQMIGTVGFSPLDGEKLKHLHF